MLLDYTIHYGRATFHTLSFDATFLGSTRSLSRSTHLLQVTGYAAVFMGISCVVGRLFCLGSVFFAGLLAIVFVRCVLSYTSSHLS